MAARRVYEVVVTTTYQLEVSESAAASYMKRVTRSAIARQLFGKTLAQLHKTRWVVVGPVNVDIIDTVIGEPVRLEDRA